jgi:hypothetical protein
MLILSIPDVAVVELIDVDLELTIVVEVDVSNEIVQQAIFSTIL